MAQPHQKIACLKWEPLVLHKINQQNVASLSLALPQNPLLVALKERKAYEFQVAYPKWRRMAESSCTLCLGVDDGCHDKQSYSGKKCGICCQATIAHNDHPQF